MGLTSKDKAVDRQIGTLGLVDLFAGAGGFTLGFVAHFGDLLTPVLANDFNKHAAATYNANFGPHCVTGDIVDLLDAQQVQLPRADIVIGGLPCQGFSLLNKKRHNDPRKQLWIPYMEVVERVGARVFVIENVRHLLNSPEHEAIEARAAEMGFLTASAVLTATDYGVPQGRQRAFIVGSRGSDPSLYFPPVATHYDPRKQPGYGNGHTPPRGVSDSSASAPRPYCTVRDAIGDLPPPEGVGIRNLPSPLNLHFGRTPTERSLERYMTIPEQGANRFDLQRRAPELTPACWVRKEKGGTDLFGRLWWDRPAPTIRTEFFKPEKGRYLHPEQHRPITHREAARLQTFPDWFIFEGSKIEIARQIGNAVPPLLGRHVASCMERILAAANE